MVEPRREQAAEETGPGRLIGVEFSQMARSVIVPLTDIPASTVIYGQEVLYAAGGLEARSRPAKTGIQEGGSRGQVDCNGDACRDNPSVVIPAQGGNVLYKPLDSSAACSRRRSTTCLHAGELALE